MKFCITYKIFFLLLFVWGNTEDCHHAVFFYRLTLSPLCYALLFGFVQSFSPVNSWKDWLFFFSFLSSFCFFLGKRISFFFRKVADFYGVYWSTTWNCLDYKKERTRCRKEESYVFFGKTERKQKGYQGKKPQFRYLLTK